MKILILIRYLIPMLLMDVDDKLGKDLARWQEIHHISAPDYAAMTDLLWYHKKFRNLVICRNRNHPIRRRPVHPARLCHHDRCQIHR